MIVHKSKYKGLCEMRILHKILCCALIFIHINACAADVLALRPASYGNTHAAPLLASPKNAHNVSVYLKLRDSQRQLSIAMPIDFHERIRMLGDYIAEIRNEFSNKEAFVIVIILYYSAAKAPPSPAEFCLKIQ